MKKIIPTKSRCLVRQEKLEKKGSLYIATQARDTEQVATVIEVGDDASIKKGSKVIFDMSAGSIVEDTDTYKLLVVDEDEILAIVEE